MPFLLYNNGTMGLDADIYLQIPTSNKGLVKLLTGAVLAGELFGYKISTYDFDWECPRYKEQSNKEPEFLHFYVNTNGSRLYTLGYERGCNWERMYEFMCNCIDVGIEVMYKGDYEGDTFEKTTRGYLDFTNRIYQKYGYTRYMKGIRPTEEEYAEERKYWV